jgi:hypothetical protein
MSRSVSMSQAWSAQAAKETVAGFRIGMWPSASSKLISSRSITLMSRSKPLRSVPASDDHHAARAEHAAIRGAQIVTAGMGKGHDWRQAIERLIECSRSARRMMGKMIFCFEQRDMPKMRQSRSGRNASYTTANNEEIGFHEGETAMIAGQLKGGAKTVGGHLRAPL